MRKKKKYFVDLETTGTDVTKDRIVEFSGIISEFGKDDIDQYAVLNPEMPIPEETSLIHGFRDEDVKDKPLFSQLAEKIYNEMKGSVVVGYNIRRFDVPLLLRQLSECGFHLTSNDIEIFDVMEAVFAFNPRNLAFAVSHYCNIDITKYHSARYDNGHAKMVYEVMEKEEFRDQNTLDEFNEKIGVSKSVDLFGKLGIDSKGFLIFTFGKHKNKRVVDNKQYANWMLNNNFQEDTKIHLRRELNK